jgi:hypothetical protein
MEDKKTDAQRKYMRHLVSPMSAKNQKQAEKTAHRYTKEHPGWHGANNTVKVSEGKGTNIFKVKLK